MTKSECGSALEKMAAVIFDLDGVITDTAEVHANAWKQMFDEYLKKRAERRKESFRPFDLKKDYLPYVDGKPRYEGVRSFLSSRGIELPYGDPSDSPEKETVCGLGNRKNTFFRHRIDKDGVKRYETTVSLIEHLRGQGIKTAVVSSSKNCGDILRAAGLTSYFDAKVDGLDREKLGLKGKPHPDIFLKAAEQIGVDPGRAAVVEDALSGVEAGRSGKFGCVIGVDRQGQREKLVEHGADMVVADLGELDFEPEDSPNDTSELPSALQRFGEMAGNFGKRRPLVFFDYDGTLTPIVEKPEDAVLSDRMRRLLEQLSERCFVAVISGRGLEDVRTRVGIDGIWYAGSHGFEVSGPNLPHTRNEKGQAALPALESAETMLNERLTDIRGAQVERKRYSIAVHFRRVPGDRVGEVEKVVDSVLQKHEGLRKAYGKKIFELQPDIDWDKGKAIFWLMEQFDFKLEDTLPIYIGDDVTDEDAFRALREDGVGIVVHEGDPKPSMARYKLPDPRAVEEFVERLVTELKEVD